MKNLALWFGAFFAATAHLPAQVSVEITMDQEQFLSGESVPVAARITNRSGQTLNLGREPGWLTFAVESLDGAIVSKTGEVPVAGEFALDSSKRAIARGDLEPYFNITKPGRYKVTATVRIPEWDKQITSAAKPFDVIQGSKLWEQEIGVPNTSSATNAMPEIRRYTLHQANYLRTQLRLYFQLTDRSGKLNKVVVIGPMLSFGQPDHQVDRLSNLHVLYQDGPHSFSYTAFNPDGDVIIRQKYAYTTRPRLKPDEQGNFSVTGGTRRVAADDVPPPTTASNDVKTIPAP